MFPSQTTFADIKILCFKEFFPAPHPLLKETLKSIRNKGSYLTNTLMVGLEKVCMFNLLIPNALFSKIICKSSIIFSIVTRNTVFYFYVSF